MTTPDVNQVTTSVGVRPTMPSVNLMPTEIAEAAKFRRFQFAMGAAVVAAVTTAADRPAEDPHRPKASWRA